MPTDAQPSSATLHTTNTHHDAESDRATPPVRPSGADQPGGGDARQRLRQLALGAGYDRPALEAIADAALDAHQPAPGQRASDRQLHEICRAVEIVIAAQRSAAQVISRIADFKAGDGDWRLAYWRAELAEAARHQRTAGDDLPAAGEATANRTATGA